METLFEYLLKSSGILAIFYAVYHLFLQGETLFNENRRFLLIGVLCALVCPFVSIPVYVEIAPAATFQIASSGNPQTVSASETGFDLWFLASLIYWTGLIFWIVKFGLQIGSLRATLRHTVITKTEGNIKYLETDRPIAPFSFFNHIVYNPAKFDSTELESILAHGKAHCKQNHSLDILISHLMTMILWINPLSYFYHRMIRQNLEFLADASATDTMASKKSYQYTMLKVSGQQIPIAIINHFYNSLIKKRIVMLQKSNSKKANVLKAALVLPALALFLFSFNTKEIYVPTDEAASLNWLEADSNKEIKLQINKDTSDEELEKIKKDLAEDGVDFSYTVVRNEKKEIIELSLDMRSTSGKEKEFRGSSMFENGGEPIDPVTVVIDPEENSLFMGNAGNMEVIRNKKNNRMTWVVKEDAEMTEEMIEKMEKEGVMVISVTEDEEEWTDDKGNVTKKFRIKKGEHEGDGEHIIIKKAAGDKDGDGEIKIIEKKILKKVEEKETGSEDGTREIHVEVITSDEGKGKNVFIMKDSDDDEDIHILEGEGDGFFFVDTDSGKKPLFIVDGKEVKEKAFKKLSPKEIATVEVLKGEKAIEKYGKKAADGVVLVTTKKN